MKFGEVRRLYETGFSIRRIARKMKCTKDTVRRVLLSLGVVMRSRGGANRVPRHVLDQRTRDVVRLYFEDMLGIKVIARRLGISPNAVRAAVHRAGLRTRGQKRIAA